MEAPFIAKDGHARARGRCREEVAEKRDAREAIREPASGKRCVLFLLFEFGEDGIVAQTAEDVSALAPSLTVRAAAAKGREGEGRGGSCAASRHGKALIGTTNFERLPNFQGNGVTGCVEYKIPWTCGRKGGRFRFPFRRRRGSWILYKL